MDRSTTPPTVIIGAGLAGLTCAQRLAEAGERVLVLDKGRRPGGRMSTRTSRSAPDLAADHGAQFFTTRGADFRRAVERWKRSGWVEHWHPRLVRFLAGGGRQPEAENERFVGIPTMASVIARLADDLPDSVEVRFGVRLLALDGEPGRWRLALDTGDDPGAGASLVAERVLLTTPAEQALVLLEPLASRQPAVERLARATLEVETAPCWATLAQLPGDGVDIGFDAAFVDDPLLPLAWVADGGSKPGRNAGAGWTLHASVDWSRAHLEDSPESVARALWQALRRLAPDLPEAADLTYLRAHRWRFARVMKALGEPCLYDADAGLGLAGDGCLGPRVESAWTSGRALAERVLV